MFKPPILPTPSAETEQKLSYNSLVESRLDQLPWTVDVPHPPAVRSLAGDSAITGLRSLVYVNSDGYCARGGYLERPFTVPAGVTGIKLELDEVKQSAVGATGDFALQLYAADGVTQVHSETFTPSASLTNVATTEITVTPGLEYKVRVVCNVAAQSRFLCGNLRARPTTSSDSFWLSFKRLDVYGHIQDTNETLWYNPRFAPQNEYSPVEFSTNNNFRVESYLTEGTYVGLPNASLSAYLNGNPLDPILTPTADGVNYYSVTLPNSNVNQVKIQSGIAVKTGYSAPVIEDRGNWLSALYFPASAYVSVVSKPIEVAVLYGDSKEAGSYSDVPGRDSLAFLLRKQNWKVIAHAQGGGSLGSDVGLSTLTVAACTAFAMKMVKQNPTKVILAMGRNDFTGNATPANIVTQLGNLADAVHAVLPSCQVVFTTWTSEDTAVEAVTHGSTAWDTMRANIIALCTSRAPWCTYIDEARYWTPAEATTYTSDTVHPNSAGYERKARGLVSKANEAVLHWPWSPLQLAPTIWLESRSLLLGGGAGTLTGVSGSGATLPTVTLSGTSSLKASPLRIECTTGGARGTAKFRWSIDNGRSWAQQDVLTAATVVLPIGITINFGNDQSYNNMMYWYANLKVRTWYDLSGNGNDFIQATDNNRPLFAASAGSANFEPSIDLSSSKTLAITGFDIASPYTIAAVGKATTQTVLDALFGKNGGYGSAFYATDSTHMALNDGTNQIAVSADMTTRHVISAVKNGASSLVRVDGVETTGTLGDANNLTNIILGYHSGSNRHWNGSIEAFLLIPRACTAAELLNIEARWRAMYGTP